MKAYLGLTLFSAILDFFAAIVLLRHYGEPGREYSEMTGMAFLTVFTGTNIYWLGNIMLLNFKFPQYISSYLIAAFLTAGQGIQDKVRFWR